MSAKILVAEDEVAVQRLLRIILSRAGYQVSVVSSGEEAVAFASEGSPDLIILDLALPSLDGFAVCRAVRSRSSAPILVLSGILKEEAKISALDLGADDYVTKPFSNGELLARVRALLRRSKNAAAGQTVLQQGAVEMNLALREVKVAQQPVRLTRTEFDILSVLMQNANAVVQSKTLLETVWKSEEQPGAEALRVHMTHLRKKLHTPDSASGCIILTEPAVGYRLKTC